MANYCTYGLWRWQQNRRRLWGFQTPIVVKNSEAYEATIHFRTFVRDLARLAEITIGMIEAGVNQIDAPTFQSSRIREVRVHTRELAIEAARAKAEVYCKVAHVTLGKVLHIEDVNADGFRVRTSANLHRDNSATNLPGEAPFV
jgi:uncharacterized protein YggE